jgi:hypothetical protein
MPSFILADTPAGLRRFFGAERCPKVKAGGL